MCAACRSLWYITAWHLILESIMSQALSQLRTPQDRVPVLKTVLEEYRAVQLSAWQVPPGDTPCPVSYAKGQGLHCWIPASFWKVHVHPESIISNSAIPVGSSLAVRRGAEGLMHCHSNCLQRNVVLWLVKKWPRTETYSLHFFFFFLKGEK